jgi:hypothetical protein
MQRLIRTGASVLALALALAACGSDDERPAASGDASSEETASSTTEPSEAEGDAEAASGICADLPPAEEATEGATRTAVIGKDYEFFAAEALALGGQQAVSFINEGEELHELNIVRIAPEETRSVEQIIQESAGADAPPATITPVAMGIACPGERTVFNADLSEPGRYAAVCFIPVGTTPESDPEAEPSGPPHAAEGMFAEFTVAPPA